MNPRESDGRRATRQPALGRPVSYSGPSLTHSNSVSARGDRHRPVSMVNLPPCPGPPPSQPLPPTPQHPRPPPPSVMPVPALQASSARSSWNPLFSTPEDRVFPDHGYASSDSPLPTTRFFETDSQKMMELPPYNCSSRVVRTWLKVYINEIPHLWQRNPNGRMVRQQDFVRAIEKVDITGLDIWKASRGKLTKKLRNVGFNKANANIIVNDIIKTREIEWPKLIVSPILISETFNC